MQTTIDVNGLRKRFGPVVALDASALQPARSARNHLLWLAHSQGLAARPVDLVIEQAGLQQAARRRRVGALLPAVPVGRIRRAVRLHGPRPGPGCLPAAAEGCMNGALRAEWTKLRTVPGTVWLLAATIVLTVAVSTAAAAATRCPVGTGCPVDTAKLSLTGGLLIRLRDA
jgi:hypothetical protein